MKNPKTKNICTNLGGVRQAKAIYIVRHQSNTRETPITSYYYNESFPKIINLISYEPITNLLSDIKLIRTETTFDLNQKVKKDMN